MKRIRKRLRYIAVFMALNLVFELAYPSAALALSGGPSQPEVQSFEPIGTSDMVDIFSGDFTYNIPLLDVEGYPLNISYNSGITMDQEASWVGLGWNINPGVINRNMRGLPDDFSGDLVTREMNIRDNQTVGVTGSLSFELLGKDFKALKDNINLSLSMSLGIKYNNYKGVGLEQSMNVAVTASGASQGSMTGGLGIKSSDEGLTISPSVSFSAQLSKTEGNDKSIGGNVGCSYNSRAGLSQMSIGLSPNLFGQMNGVVSKLTGGNSSSLSFGVQTYSPSIGNQMVNATYTLNAKTGATVFGQDATAGISGYYSSQRLANNYDQVPAYGYLNLHKGAGLQKVNLDYNREKDGGFSLNTPALPLTNLTYDIYSVMGQGIGGSYRMFRGDMGSVYDSYTGNTNVSGSLGVEIAVGNTAKNGIDFTITDVNTYTEKWVNPASNKLRFRGSNNDPLYESAYFRESGEQSVDNDPEFFQKMGGERPVRFNLTQTTDEHVANDQFVNDYGQTLGVPSENTRDNRQRRNQVITYMTRGEMRRFGLEDQLKNTYNAPDHHIGQITALRPDGGRYIFGIAAYNHKQEETTFNVGVIGGGKHYPKGIASSGLIKYRNVDNSVHNDRGIDRYYSNQITPGFAHSYLLTSVLSADYVDIDGQRGPTAGDMGSYTVFHYTKVEEPYQWRTPVEQFQANFNEGMKSDPLDDKANYIYGVKELWYVSGIETKNYIAIFTISDRNDAHGVKDENGGLSNVSMKKLDKISLYSRADYEANGLSAIPIKEVHFEYDYELCPNIPNQVNPGDGKLTLKKIYFTYGESYKAKYNAYTFEYNGENPDYSLKSSDRWGNYKENTASTFAYNDVLSTAEFPYVEQDKVEADANAESWNLTDIMLPSGGKISVTYESDDYAYVQNKRAMEMFKIAGVGFCEDPSDPPHNGLGMDIYPIENISTSAIDKLYSGGDNRVFLFFKLRTPLPNTSSASAYKSQIGKLYMEGIKDLYFRFLVNITKPGYGKYDNAYEYVSGYGEVEDYGVSPYIASGSDYLYGYVKLKAAKRSDGPLSLDCHPISKAAWHFGRLNIPRYVYQQQDPTATGIEQIIFALANGGMIKNIQEFVLGPNTAMQVKDYGNTFNGLKSWIRLNNPDKKRLGGGARVAKIEMSDEWATMESSPGNPSYSYGQVYDYTTFDEEGNEISSGVASYEPGIGGDENPFKLPVYNGNKEERLLAPDDLSYMEEPFGESFFPSPSVGYSKVTVKNLQYTVPENGYGVTRNATGKVVHEFYTAKEFPTITRRTDLKAEPYKTNPLMKLFTFKNKDFMSASQGFVVELNNMHGKQKKQMVYAENQGDPISGVEYKYKCKPLGNGTFQLVNDVEVVHPDGHTSTASIGMDYDFVADMRSQQSVTQSVSAQFNLAAFAIAALPAILPTLFPGYTKDERRFRSATTTKVINRSAITEETIAYDLGARVSTKNMAYDSETGDVLLTQTVNNFNEPVYTFNYPAHWYYDGMGQAYKNIGLELGGITFDASGLSNNIANAGSYFVPGDELAFNGVVKLWVSEVNASGIKVITESGGPYQNGTAGSIKVMRSGRRNQQSLNIGSLTMLTNPLIGLQENKFSAILQANSIIYSEEWKTYCDCFNQPNTNLMYTSNPYLTGEKGVWRNSRSYLHLADRTQSYENNNTNIRKDGVFTSFSPFWNWNGSAWEIQTDFWQWNATITQFSPNGQEMENVDPLERYSAGIYAYNNTLTVGIGANAALNELGFDAFEDYSFFPCSQDHFSYRPFDNKIDNTQSHTGKRSLKVLPGDNVIITKDLEPCDE